MTLKWKKNYGKIRNKKTKKQCRKEIIQLINQHTDQEIKNRTTIAGNWKTQTLRQVLNKLEQILGEEMR